MFFSFLEEEPGIDLSNNTLILSFRIEIQTIL